MSTPVIHNTFTIERTYNASPEKVFGAFSDKEKKRRWFVDGEGFITESHELDFRIGGFERTRFRPVDGPPMTNDCLYMDIVDRQRIVFAYSMTIAGAPLSSSLATIELSPSGKGTKMLFTEHTVYLDGKDGSADRRAGTEELLDALARELGAHA